MIAALTSWEGAVTATRERPEWSLLSIRDPGMPPRCPAARGPRLDLEFEDIAIMSPRGPTREHARAIVAFARSRSDDERIIVHCLAGVSRSSAALAGVLAARDLPVADGVQAAIDLAVRNGWRSASSGIRPNALLLAMLDVELGLAGELVKTVTERWPYRLPLDWTAIWTEASR